LVQLDEEKKEAKVDKTTKPIDTAATDKKLVQLDEK
jgi:hypothetical protein